MNISHTDLNLTLHKLSVIGHMLFLFIIFGFIMGLYYDTTVIFAVGISFYTVWLSIYILGIHQYMREHGSLMEDNSSV